MPRIPLPSAARSDKAIAHPFPFQIGTQALEFLHGSIFYATVTDLATGAYIHEHRGRAKIEAYLEAQGHDRESCALGWEILQKYRDVFGATPFQTVLVSLCSHWDWYVRRLCEFIRIGRAFEHARELDKKLGEQFQCADRLSFSKQIPVISAVAGVAIEVAAGDMDELCEMALVRNLGLHNRWEADATYVQKSHRNSTSIGDIRIVRASELHTWRGALTRLVQTTSSRVSLRFGQVPADAI